MGKAHIVDVRELSQDQASSTTWEQKVKWDSRWEENAN